MKIKNYFKKKNYLLQLFCTIAGLCCIPLIVLQLVMVGWSAQGFSKMNEEVIYENLASIKISLAEYSRAVLKALCSGTLEDDLLTKLYL